MKGAHDITAHKVVRFFDKFYHLSFPLDGVALEPHTRNPCGNVFQKWANVNRPYATRRGDPVGKQPDAFLGHGQKCVVVRFDLVAINHEQCQSTSISMIGEMRHLINILIHVVRKRCAAYLRVRLM